MSEVSANTNGQISISQIYNDICDKWITIEPKCSTYELLKGIAIAHLHNVGDKSAPVMHDAVANFFMSMSLNIPTVKVAWDTYHGNKQTEPLLSPLLDEDAQSSVSDTSKIIEEVKQITGTLKETVMTELIAYVKTLIVKDDVQPVNVPVAQVAKEEVKEIVKEVAKKPAKGPAKEPVKVAQKPKWSEVIHEHEQKKKAQEVNVEKEEISNEQDDGFQVVQKKHRSPRHATNEKTIASSGAVFWNGNPPINAKEDPFSHSFDTLRKVFIHGKEVIFPKVQYTETLSDGQKVQHKGWIKIDHNTFMTHIKSHFLHMFTDQGEWKHYQIVNEQGKTITLIKTNGKITPDYLKPIPDDIMRWHCSKPATRGIFPGSAEFDAAPLVRYSTIRQVQA